MTIATMHTEFKVGVDKVDSLNHPGFEPEEIDVFLNNAIEKYVAQRVYGMNPRRLGLEETQKRLDDIANLISNSAITPTTNAADNKPNGRFVSLPADYRFAIQEEVVASYTDCNSQTVSVRVPVLPVTHDRYNKLIRSPFYKPSVNRVYRLGFGVTGTTQRFELVGDGVISLTSYVLRYLRNPVAVRYGTTYAIPTTDVDCDLKPHTHKELIKMAVSEALGNIQAPNTGLVKQELNEIE